MMVRLSMNSGIVSRYFVSMIKKKAILFFLLFLAWTCAINAQDEHYISERGFVSFKSDAPLEIIQAESKALRGVINPETKSFAFTININSFQGFNSDIQRTHFLENYMEQKRFPQATFTGKIIENVSFMVPGTYSVRAKGELNIHGIKKERIIRGTLVVKDGSAQLTTNFTVPVADHGIAIPKIVKQKIAEQIAINLDIDFVLGSKP